MRRPLILILAVLALGAVLPSAAGAATKRAPKPTLQVLSTHRYGSVLVDGRGYMVYGFSLDTPGHDNCQSQPECLNLWPPVLAPHTLVLGRGVRKSLVHSIRLKDGDRQLTYNGWPLYNYVQDVRPKQTSNVGLFLNGGFWPAIAARTGKFVPTPPKTS